MNKDKIRGARFNGKELEEIDKARTGTKETISKFIRNSAIRRARRLNNKVQSND